MSDALQEENTNTLSDLVDELYLLDKEIEKIKSERLNSMEEKRDLLKKKLERLMHDGRHKEVEWLVWKAIFVIQNRTKVDDKTLFAKYNIPDQEILECTKNTVASFIKISGKK